MTTNQQLDKIITKLIGIDSQLSQTIKQDQFQSAHHTTLGILDQHTVILQRLDQERVFTSEIISRMQKQLDSQQEELNRMKKALKIS